MDSMNPIHTVFYTVQLQTESYTVRSDSTEIGIKPTIIWRSFRKIYDFSRIVTSLKIIKLIYKKAFNQNKSQKK